MQTEVEGFTIFFMEELQYSLREHLIIFLVSFAYLLFFLFLLLYLFFIFLFKFPTKKTN